jgi:hypothetical protein
LDESDVLALAVERLGIRNGDPLACAGVRCGVEVLGIIVAVLGSLETEFDTRRGGVVNGGFELGFGLGLEPEQPAGAETRDQDDPGQQRPQGLEIRLK